MWQFLLSTSVEMKTGVFPVVGIRQAGSQTSSWRSSKAMDLIYLEQLLMAFGDENPGPRVCIASILSIKATLGQSNCF